MLLSSLRAMVSRVMTRTIDDRKIKDVSRHIKLFLQCFHMFTKSRKIDIEEDQVSTVMQGKGGRKRKWSKPVLNMTTLNSELEDADFDNKENGPERIQRKMFRGRNDSIILYHHGFRNIIICAYSIFQM